MKPLAIAGAVVLALIVLGGGAMVSSSNAIIAQDAVCEQMIGQVNSALQRRMDLIPNLVATVKGYASHEKETLEGVMAARAAATQVKLDAGTLADPSRLQKFNAAQGQLSAALGRLMVVSERYPDLKADTHFSDLMAQLEGTENRIKIERDNYNAAVTALNVKIRTFPGSLVNALMAHVNQRQVFQADEAAKTAPKVDFGTAAPASPASTGAPAAANASGTN